MKRQRGGISEEKKNSRIGKIGKREKGEIRSYARMRSTLERSRKHDDPSGNHWTYFKLESLLEIYFGHVSVVRASVEVSDCDCDVQKLRRTLTAQCVKFAAVFTAVVYNIFENCIF